MRKHTHTHQSKKYFRGARCEKLEDAPSGIRGMWNETRDNFIVEMILAFLIIPACLFVSSLPDVFQLSGYTFSRTSATFTSTPFRDTGGLTATANHIETAAPTPMPTHSLKRTPLFTATATPTPMPISECHYLIFEGDTLGEIAQYFQVSIEKIMGANDLANPNLIIAGSELIIPGSKSPCPEGPLP